MKAVEVNRGTQSEGDDTQHIDILAKAHGFPGLLSPLVIDKFDENANVFMKENFKTAIPVS